MAVIDTKPGKKIADSVYISGFCAIGSHEGTSPLSPSGKQLKTCNLGGRADAGRAGMIICTCECHTMTREMEIMTGVEIPPAVINRQLISPGNLLGYRRDDAPTGKAPGGGDVNTPSVVLESGARFAVTPTGRAARGQLEEQVRIAVCTQVKAAGEDMIASLGLTPQLLAGMISKDSPPSTGAIYSVLKRWEAQAYVTLGESPFRFIGFTDLGKRTLLR